MDPEEIVQCPFDKNHRVRGSRLPYHLVKCQQNNLSVARKLATCPFNACHRVPHHELRSHVASCPNKDLLNLLPKEDTSLSQRQRQREVPVAQAAPPWQEDWEAEVENLEDPPPFIFNGSMDDLQHSLVTSVPTNQRRGLRTTGNPAAQKRP